MTFQQNPKPLRIVTQDVAHAAIVYIQRALLRAMTVVIVGIGPDRLDIHHRQVAALAEKALVVVNIGDRSEERRVGKESVSSSRYRWSEETTKKTNNCNNHCHV